MSKILTTLLVSVVITSTGCRYDSTGRIEVFHKNKEPSLRTLAKTKTVLSKHEGDYKIAYYIINDPTNAELIRKYNLPETHFPFAVVINGRYSALIDGRTVYFLEFPLFMKGIGRHEGGWSMEDLDRVLSDVRLLLDQNVLPESFHHEHAHEPCPGEAH